MGKDILFYVDDGAVVVDDVSKSNEDDVIIEFDCLVHSKEFMKLSKSFAELFLNKKYSDLELTDFVETKIGFLYRDIIENIDTFIEAINIDDIHIMSTASVNKLKLMNQDFQVGYTYLENLLIKDDRQCFIDLFEEFLKISDKEDKQQITEIFNKYIGA